MSCEYLEIVKKKGKEEKKVQVLVVLSRFFPEISFGRKAFS
jgi:hypothetical protein